MRIAPFGFLAPGASAPPPWDPATDTLTAWWQGSYHGIPGTPWSGTASAGNSGSHDLSDLFSNSPPQGTAVDGYSPADFNGTSNFLLGTTGTVYMPVAAYYGWCLFYPRALGTAALTAADTNPAVWAENNGKFGISLTNNPSDLVQVWQNDPDAGTIKGNEHAITLNTWNLLIWRYTGTKIRSRLNTGSVVASADIANRTGGGTMRAGVASNSAKYDGKLLDTGMKDSAGDDADFDNAYSYVAARYPSARSW